MKSESKIAAFALGRGYCFSFGLFQSIMIGQDRKFAEASVVGMCEKRSHLQNCAKASGVSSAVNNRFSFRGAAISHISIMWLSCDQSINGERYILNCHQQAPHQDKATAEAANQKCQPKQCGTTLCRVSLVRLEATAAFHQFFIVPIPCLVREFMVATAHYFFCKPHPESMAVFGGYLSRQRGIHLS